MAMLGASKVGDNEWSIRLSPTALSEAGIAPQSLVGCRYQSPTALATEHTITEVDTSGGIETYINITSTHVDDIDTVTLDAGHTSAIVASDSLQEIISFTNAANITYQRPGGL